MSNIADTAVFKNEIYLLLTIKCMQESLLIKVLVAKGA
jgi:hypothetical protein